MTFRRILGSLPVRFRWTLHNIVAHPVSEVAWQLGWHRLSDKIHDQTVPDETVKTPRRAGQNPEPRREKGGRHVAQSEDRPA